MNGDGASSGAQKRERVTPEVLQAIVLDDIAVSIKELIDLTKLQIPQGHTPSMPLTITTTLRELPLAPPWFSVKIINDGPETVLLNINDTAENPIPVNSGDTLDLDFGAPKVERLFLITETATAAIRLIGLY